MDFMSYILASSLLILSMILSLPLTYGQLVPALFIFGDSAVDVGNNNNVWTIVKVNFPPHGRDFINKTSIGRFSNGKLATDFIAESLLFNSYQPAYLGREARGRNLLIGANFALAASGCYDATADIFLAIPLSEQLQNYEEYHEKVVMLVGDANASTIFSGGMHKISTGSSDFVQNYYINPLLNNTRTPEQFFDSLLQKYVKFVEDLSGLGARKIGVTTLPPIGCLPATRLKNLTLIVFDIYHSHPNKNHAEHDVPPSMESPEIERVSSLGY
ncbi:hypothetical protein TIFTF001_025307 [Ficus carica]|uniref:GDSL esterase/lipase n=1 Tax=Ficus carica TaxID=3494 RepID=A0AA88AJL1_FICCA|nr:hypothetical protein TIFTF001_025307 [Ficus carica]